MITWKKSIAKLKKIFVDTNIIIDLIGDRKPYSKYAVLLFSKAETKHVQLFTSSLSIATTHYILKKYLQEKSLRAVLTDLLDYLEIIPVDKEIIRRSLKSQHKDLEDAMQINAASSMQGIQYIVTRNPKDFKLSEIEVVSPELVVGLI